MVQNRLYRVRHRLLSRINMIAISKCWTILDLGLAIGWRCSWIKKNSLLVFEFSSFCCLGVGGSWQCLPLLVEFVVAVWHIPARVAVLGGGQLLDLDGATVVAVATVVRGEAVPPLRLAFFFGCDLSVDFGGHLGSGLGDQSAFCHPGSLLGRGHGSHKFGSLLGKGQAHFVFLRQGHGRRVGSSG